MCTYRSHLLSHRMHEGSHGERMYPRYGLAPAKPCNTCKWTGRSRRASSAFGPAANGGSSYQENVSVLTIRYMPLMRGERRFFRSRCYCHFMGVRQTSVRSLAAGLHYRSDARRVYQYFLVPSIECEAYVDARFFALCQAVEAYFAEAEEDGGEARRDDGSSKYGVREWMSLLVEGLNPVIGWLDAGGEGTFISEIVTRNYVVHRSPQWQNLRRRVAIFIGLLKSFESCSWRTYFANSDFPRIRYLRLSSAVRNTRRFLDSPPRRVAQKLCNDVPP